MSSGPIPKPRDFDGIIEEKFLTGSDDGCRSQQSW
jgi:hypothetical protein